MNSETKNKKQGGTLADIKQQAVEQLASGKPAATPKNTHDFFDLYSERNEPQNFLIEDLIPDAEVFGLIGEDGIGKTQIMTQLALCVAMGKKDFIGLKLNAKHGRALICATEDSKKKFTKAVSKIFDGMTSKFDPKKVGLKFTEGSNFDDLDSLVTEIEDHLKIQHHDLVLVDALLDCFTMIDGEANSNSHASKILSKFQHLCNTYECALGFIHHAAKTKITEKHKEGKIFLHKNDSLGAGRITSKARTILALSHDFKTVTTESTMYTNYLHAVKVNLQSRYYVKHAIQLTFNTATLLHDSEGIVDIDSIDNPEQHQQTQSQVEDKSTKRLSPKDVPDADYKTNSIRAFDQHDVLQRKDLVEKLKRYFGVGGNKIEEKGGFLMTMIDKGFIVSTNGVFRLSDNLILELAAAKTIYNIPQNNLFDSTPADEPAIADAEIKMPSFGEFNFPEPPESDDDKEPF